MARLYSNENFPLPVVEELRKLGHDALTVQESGNAGKAITDEAMLTFAVGKERAILTMNRRHFILLHEASHDHFGIVVCTFDPDFAGQARRIHSAIEPGKALYGQLIRINRPSP